MLDKMVEWIPHIIQFLFKLKEINFYGFIKWKLKENLF